MRDIITRTFTTHKSILRNVLTNEVVEERFHDRKPDSSQVIRSYLRSIDEPIPLKCDIVTEKQKYEMTRKKFMQLATKVELEDF